MHNAVLRAKNFIRYLLRISLSLLLLLQGASLAQSVSDNPLVLMMQQQLETERARSQVLAQKLKVFQTLLTRAPSEIPQPLSRILIIHDMAQAEYDNIDLTLKIAQLEANLNQQTLEDLQRHSPNIQGVSLSDRQQMLQEQRKLLDLQQQKIHILHNTLKLAQKTLDTSKTWYSRFLKQNQHTLFDKSRETQKVLVTQLQAKQQAWLTQLETLNIRLQGNQLPGTMGLSHALTLLVSEETSNLIQMQLNLEVLQSKQKVINNILKEHTSLAILNGLQKSLENLSNQLQVLKSLLQKKIDFLERWLRLATENRHQIHLAAQDIQVLNTLRQLSIDYQLQLKQIEALYQQIQNDFGIFTQKLHSQLANRQNLPGFDLQAWVRLAKKIKEIPEVAKDRLADLYRLTRTNLEVISWWNSGFIAFLFLSWISFCLFLKVWIGARLKATTTSKGVLPAPVIGVFFQLLDKQLISFLMVLGVGIGLWSLHVPLQAFSWILTLLVVLIGFSMLFQAIRLLLLDNSEEPDRYAVTLYYRLKWTLRIGSAITALSLIAHKLGVHYEVRDLFGRLFMLFLLIIAFILLKGWQRVPQLLEESLTQRPRFLKQVVRWISFLLPMSLLLNAMLGLVGYVQLAWAIAVYQGLLLLAVIIYFVIKGFLDELTRILSEQSIRRFRNGWLWSEALLKPLHQLLKLGALFSIFGLLFRYFDWNEQWSIFNINIRVLFSKKLLSVAGFPITSLTLLKLGISVTILIWLIRWTREFAYRWLFSDLKDLGLRNSLSVLAQYSAISVGILTILHVAGLNLTTLKFILGGFSVGIGFGLRDIFNNFVTGILLLVERPVKIGDWVTVGTHDGQVTHIGARSITVNTEDHQELIVPNADIFAKQFTNWTRHDSIVRVTVPISVHRGDDPAKIREIILEVIGTIPKILNRPNPEVYFKETDRILLEFHVGYYVDVNQIISRAEVRSQFLFILWNRFKKENILPPDVLHELHIHGGLDNAPEVRA